MYYFCDCVQVRGVFQWVTNECWFFQSFYTCFRNSESLLDRRLNTNSYKRSIKHDERNQTKITRVICTESCVLGSGDCREPGCCTRECLPFHLLVRVPRYVCQVPRGITRLCAYANADQCVIFHAWYIPYLSHVRGRS